MFKSTFATIVGGIAMFAAVPAAAEVVERHADGFTLRFAASMETSPGDVVLALEDIGGWWDGAHTYSGDAANLRLTLEPGGCFCEALPDGSLFEHGRVVARDDGELVLNAPLGPLKGVATRSDLTFSWPDEGVKTRVTVTFIVEGPGLGSMADPVNGVLDIQLGRLVRYVEKGEP